MTRGEHSLNAKKRLIYAIAANSAFLGVEVVFGIMARSLALLGDAGHNFSDSFALVLSLIAVTVMTKPKTEEKTFGYHRMGILVAFINSLVVILISFYLFYEALGRIAFPSQVKGGLVVLIAGLGFIVNGGVAMMLRKGRGDLNIKSAFLHLLADALVSLGVVVSGLVILLTGWNLIDPIVTVAIGLLMLAGAFQIVGETVNILMEAVPRSLSYQEVLADMAVFDAVEDVHDLHIWEIGSDIYALSAHVVVSDERVSEHRALLKSIKEMLKERYNVVHSTLELEVEPCPPDQECHFNRG